MYMSEYWFQHHKNGRPTHVAAPLRLSLERPTRGGEELGTYIYLLFLV